MSVPVSYQVPYKNQLQFNLGVPLTAQNMAVQFNRPSPIFVERVGGQHRIPTKCVPKQTSGFPNDSRDSALNYSALSEDKMEMMSLLAKRDIRNRKLQSQMKRQSPSSESPSPVSSPSRTRLYQKNSCERFARQETIKRRNPLTAKQADKNRRFGAVQTPPPRRPVSYFRRDDSMMSAKNTSANMTRESDMYFPTKPIMPEGGNQPKDELEKLQLEIEGYLLLVENVGKRAISEPGTKFLLPPGRGKRKDEFLFDEENSDRARIRVEEQNTRLTRNLYNLKLKVKHIAHADFSKSVKKSQMSSQLDIVHRGAVKALQTFVNQLPHKDLREGMPSHYHELSTLLRQLTTLSTVMNHGKQSDGDKRLLAVLDRVDNLNMEWGLEHKKADTVTDKKEKKIAITKDWVSDTKVDKNIFVMKSQQQLQFPFQARKSVSQPQRQQIQRGRPKKRAMGKENRRVVPAATSGKDQCELRSAIATLLQPKAKATGPISREHHTSSGATWDVEMGRQSHSQDHRKGYLLPYDLIAKREKAQRAVALSNQEKRYANSTVATNLKKSASRPNSAPANARTKGVNFELDRQYTMPWVPPGRSSRSRSLSAEHTPQSRSPFYLHDMDTEAVRSMFPDKHSLREKKADNVLSYGFQSLPIEKKMRSADVSSSFIDEVEHRLLRRLMGRVATEEGRTARGSTSSHRKEHLSAADGPGDEYSDLDEPLDTTDLGDEAKKEAVSAVDAPTIENMKLRLAEMQREQREIRQRWSTINFTDIKPKSRIFTSSEIQSERFRDPPALEVTRMSKTERPKYSEIPTSKDWSAEPVIFTKSSIKSKVSYLHTVDHTTMGDLQPESSLTQGKPPKKLVTLKQTAVEKISAERDRFDSYLRKRSHHPSGKFDPWKLVEEISDEILSDCLTDVASEVELISEEIANHMYKSEFIVDTTSQQKTVSQREHYHQSLGGGGVQNQSLGGGGVQNQLFGGGGIQNQSLGGGGIQNQSLGAGGIKNQSLGAGGVQNQSFGGGGIQNQSLGGGGIQNQSMGDGVTFGHERLVRAESAGIRREADSISSPGLGEALLDLDSRDQHIINSEKLLSQRSMSISRSTTHPSPDKLSPILSAAEPMLDNMSHLLYREDISVERGGGDVEKEASGKKDEYDDDYEESSKEDSYRNEDEDSDGYGEDDFEDVTEDELK